MESKSIGSKLPSTGTSIFAVMSKLAIEHDAINLSQGFPGFSVSGELIDRVTHYMQEGFNQYAPMPGIERLRQAISGMFTLNHDVIYNPESEITITAGATQALFTAITAFVRRGDEVIILEPAYDSYAPAVELNGGIVRSSRLLFPSYAINREELDRLMSPKTRMIIVNSPHNPTGSLLSEDDMLFLQELTNGTDTIVLSDEVYEHIIFDGMQHQSACRFEGLRKRSLVVGSFGKTFHATGWKTGFALGREYLMKEFRKVHQFVVFASNTPVQHALADYVSRQESYRELGGFFQRKREVFVEALKGSRFKVLDCHGTYFQLLDYSAISDEDELAFAKRLTVEHGVASVPVSPFYTDGVDNKTLRFCFAKQDKMLKEAADILCRI